MRLSNLQILESDFVSLAQMYVSHVPYTLIYFLIYFRSCCRDEWLQDSQDKFQQHGQNASTLMRNCDAFSLFVFLAVVGRWGKCYRDISCVWLPIGGNPFSSPLVLLSLTFCTILHQQHASPRREKPYVKTNIEVKRVHIWIAWGVTWARQTNV